MNLRTKILTPILLGSMGFSALAQNPMEKRKEKRNSQTTVIHAEAPLTQIAILLDTSGSMKGLIDQARCQLWNVVSELAKAKKEGKSTKLQVAIYEYGSNKISKENGHLRQVLGFTENLDQVSKSLFSLVTDGGNEFCGAAINHALTELKWSDSPADYKAIFIAGNESFDQGSVTFGEALNKALSKPVLINSIYCVQKAKPKDSPDKIAKEKRKWKAAAQLAEGMFFEINHNHHITPMKTPYDSEMRELNERMNRSFVWFGEGAKIAATNQTKQDQNAANMSDQVFADRMSAKIGHLYHHASHDLVDAIAHGADLSKMNPAKMPKNLKAMTAEQRKAFIDGKAAERNSVRREMADVISKRYAFIQKKISSQPSVQNQKMMVLGDALLRTVQKQAQDKGFGFDHNPTVQIKK